MTRCSLINCSNTTSKIGAVNGDLYFLSPLRTAGTLRKALILLKEFAGDLYALWRYGSAFPTFLKIIGTIILCLIALMPIFYPIFMLFVTYFTFKGIFLSFWLDQPWRLYPVHIFRDAVSVTCRSCSTQDMWKVRDVLTRGLLLAHSLATSVDYLCVMQGLLDEA